VAVAGEPAELAADVPALLEHGHGVPCRRQARSGRETAQPGADHHDPSHAPHGSHPEREGPPSSVRVTVVCSMIIPG
jgi:hypothetical protein